MTLAIKSWAAFFALASVAALATAADGAPSCPGNPDALGTARVLAVEAATTPRVGRKQFPATFFLIGRNALDHPGLAQRALAEGHTVAYHSFSHPMLNRMPIAAAQSDIERGM